MTPAPLRSFLLSILALAAPRTLPAQDTKGVEAEVAAIKPVPSWPLRDAFVAKMTAEKGPPPKDVFLFPLGEVYRGDNGAFFFAGVERGEFRPDLGAWGFRKKDGAWEIVEDKLLFDGWGRADELLFKGPGETRIVRRSGLSLQIFPAFLRFVMREQPARFNEARRAGDWKRVGAIVEETLIGYSLRMAEEPMQDLTNLPRKVESVRIADQKVQGDLAVVTFEVTEDGRTKSERMVLVKEGNGWVIQGPYVPPPGPGDKTMADMRTLATAIETYNIDKGSYPAAGDGEALRALLEPAYVHKAPLADEWGTPFRYVLSTDKKTYRIISAGADKTFTRDPWAAAPESVRDQESADPKADIVLENGGFIRRPKKE